MADGRADSARTRSDVRRNIRTAVIRSFAGSNVLVVLGSRGHRRTHRRGQIGTVCVRLAVLEQTAVQVPVDKVVKELQHAHLGVLQNETSHVYGQGLRDGVLVHL